jgi:hypothetical protein
MKDWSIYGRNSAGSKPVFRQSKIVCDINHVEYYFKQESASTMKQVSVFYHNCLLEK